MKLIQEIKAICPIYNAFGPDGEGYIRICYTSKYEDIKEALRRMEEAFEKKQANYTCVVFVIDLIRAYRGNIEKISK